MPKTLLLADDSVTIQKVVGISFASEDIVLVTVDNGTAAIAKAKEIRPDIVLADVVMPGMSGYEVCRALKADASLRHVPVLLLTGTFEAFDENKAREVGADGHITKPFEAQALVDTVNARLAAAQPKAAPAPAPAPASAAPPAKSSLFGEDEAFDFLGDETTEPSDFEREPTGTSDAGREDSFAFEGNDLDSEEGDALHAEPLETDAMTRVVGVGEAPDLASELDDENAETLPPEEDSGQAVEAPAATQVLFAAEEPAALESLQSTRVMLGEPEAAGVGTISPRDAGVADPLADMIGGTPRTSSEPYDVEATDLGDPFADDPEVATHRTPTAVDMLRPAAAEAPDGDLFGDDDAPATDDAPALIERRPEPAPVPAASARSAQELPTRDELRSMLEKVAWEAFGDVTDRIVRETVQRVEQICWDVIPKLAETLIREEIRKLKDESD